MELPPDTGELALRYALYIQELQDFFAVHDLCYGSPGDLTQLADRLAASDIFTAELASMVRSIIFRERGVVPLSGLLALVALSSGGAQIESSAHDVQPALDQLSSFLAAIARAPRDQPPPALAVEPQGAEAAPHTAFSPTPTALPYADPAEHDSFAPAPFNPAEHTDKFLAAAMLTAADLQRSRLTHLPEPAGSNRRLWVAGGVALPLILLAVFLVNRATPSASTSPEPYLSATVGASVPTPGAHLAAAIPTSPVAAPFLAAQPPIPAGAAPARTKTGSTPLRTPAQPPFAASVPNPSANPPQPSVSALPALPPVSSAASAPTSKSDPTPAPAPPSRPAAAPSSAATASAPSSTVQRGSFVVASGIMSSHLLASSQPKYPELAKLARVEGPVILQAVVSRTGKVASVKVLSGHRFLRKAAIKAVRGWRYRPYLVGGRPVDMATIITLDFKLP